MKSISGAKLYRGNHAIRLYICSVKYFEETSEASTAGERSYKWKDCDAIVQTDYLRPCLVLIDDDN